MISPSWIINKFYWNLLTKLVFSLNLSAKQALHDYAILQLGIKYSINYKYSGSAVGAGLQLHLQGKEKIGSVIYRGKL